MYFSADDGVSGRELWKSDGTAPGTILVDDIAPGLQGSSPTKMFAVEPHVDFDRRGVTLSEEIAVPFPDLKLTMRVTTDASDEEIEALKRDLARFCPVSKVLREAGTRIEEAWVVERP